MPQSLSQVMIHVIFSTKNRHPFIEREFAPELHAYIATLLRDMHSMVYRVGGPADHVHAACTLPRVYSQADFVQKMKGVSSKWMKQRGVHNFYWQNGYGAFSFGPDGEIALVNYIDNQWEHHRHISFKNEVRELFEEYGIEYDERYVWD
ncbi:MAG: transposase [bacterium]|nr:transposase [bacterium]